MYPGMFMSYLVIVIPDIDNGVRRYALLLVVSLGLAYLNYRQASARMHHQRSCGRSPSLECLNGFFPLVKAAMASTCIWLCNGLHSPTIKHAMYLVAECIFVELSSTACKKKLPSAYCSSKGVYIGVSQRRTPLSCSGRVLMHCGFCSGCAC